MDTETFLTHFGSHPDEHYGVINPPVYRASTLAFNNLKAYETALKTPYEQPYYGRLGTPTVHQLEEALAALEGGFRAMMMPSGLAACNHALFALLAPGDHILMTDSVYGHVREFCDDVLKPRQIETTYYDPLIEDDLDLLIRPNTKILYLESPGSNTFEVQNIKKLTQIAKQRGLTTVLDNTWATALNLRGFDYDIDVVIHSCTKFFSGHADGMSGVIICNEKTYKPIKDIVTLMGQYVSPDECYQVIKGMRTLSIRLKQHNQTSIKLATWLTAHPLVKAVLHPQFANCPGHQHWQTHYKGATGLLTIILEDKGQPALHAFFDNLQTFRIGQSWGGYESLMIPVYPFSYRQHCSTLLDGQYVRIFPGLESIDDLKADLFDALERYRKAPIHDATTHTNAT